MSDLVFKPKARLLLQLGDQLIRNEGIAVLEIIKNSYDAGASFVRISMKNIENPEYGEIIIEDDGIGMDKELIENVWMQPGTDYKLKNNQPEINPRLKNRIPIGEKGIGRFGVHKLGNNIEIISKKEGHKEILLEINWRNFDTGAMLNEVPVILKERVPEYFTEGLTGTKIMIKDLKNIWTKDVFRELYRSVNSLSSPFEAIDSFEVLFDFDNKEWLKGLLTFEEIKNYALYYAYCAMQGNYITSLEYEFRPWDTMSKLEGRQKELNSIRITEDVKDEKDGKNKIVDIDLSAYGIGDVVFKIYIFDRSPKILSLGLVDKKGLKEYLDDNGGIRVFRGGIRVYDYGEKSNDWLNLDIRRVNQPGKTISNNIMIGAVYLDRQNSSGLIEKTNREGFVENESYGKFLKAVNFVLDKVLSERNIDKEKIRKLYGSGSPSEPVIGNLFILKEKIIRNVPAGGSRDELIDIIRDIEKDYNKITEIYTRSASAGLSLGIVIHEVEKIISELLAAVDKIPTDKHISNLVRTLHKTVSDYAVIIGRSLKTKEDLAGIIDQSLSNIQYRIKAHNVYIVRRYKDTKINAEVKCAFNLVVSTIINLIDNSIWWQNYAGITNKKILIDIIEEFEGYVSILIADNGPGFSIPPEEAVKPFISDKPGGMGLGLHLADAVMSGQKGQLVFPDKGEFILPAEFANGALLLLAFRR